MKSVYILTIVIISISAMVYYPVSVLYGDINFNTIASVLFSNKDESLGFLKAIPIRLYMVSLIIFILSVIVMKIKFSLPAKVKAIFLLLGGVIVSSPILYAYSQKGRITSSDIKNPTARFFITLPVRYMEVMHEINLMKEYSQKQPTWNITGAEPKYKIFIVVIGESVRRDFMSAYSFPIDNTPYMRTAPGILFSNYISAASSTQVSLVNTITAGADNINNNIITLANSAFFSTYWLSNQGNIGMHDTSVSNIGKNANHAVFLRKGNSDDSGKSSDFKLIPEFEKIIKTQSDNNSLIVIHLFGSHPPSCSRVDSEPEIKFISDDLSCYVQSIKNTDDFLKKIDAILRENSNSWSMMYFSDHGLAIHDKNMKNKEYMLHSGDFKDVYNVPFFIISSDSSSRSEINQRRTAFDFLKLFSEWTGIHETSLEHECRLLSDKHCESENLDKVISFLYDKVSYSKMQDDIIPTSQ
ncbi:sulfatase-like hydrolase/transferase [Arsenophonus nasoniae]|uniref:sulfatase-like hydrolase/transferase n=1 Tax=Arsenophonus nasoniae TaxID=638 RepID=UPI00387947AF